MNERYLDYLNEAITKSKELQLVPPTYEYSNNGTNVHSLSNAVMVFLESVDKSIIAGVMDKQEYRIGCVEIHKWLEEELKAKGFNSIFTIGDTQLKNQRLFHTSMNELISEVNGENKHSNTPMNLHSWLTIDDAIVDVTIIPFIEKKAWLSGDLLGGDFSFISSLADEKLRDLLTYHPMLVGSKFADLVMNYQ